MTHYRHLSKQYAFQVDKKILELEDEEFVRLDIPATERLNLRPLFAPKRTSQSSMGQFAMTAVGLFLLLFTITNAPSYGQIIAASLFTANDPAPIVTELDPNALIETTSEDGVLPLILTPTPYENRIEIPSLKINAPIVEPTLGLEALKGEDWNALEESISKSLNEGVVHYPGTAEPGQKGNVFLTGHSSNVFWEQSLYNSVFALLPKIEEGAEIILYFGQEQYTYKVISKREVQPTDVSVLKQGDGKELTLMTCTPVGTRFRRLVVTAQLVD